MSVPYHAPSGDIEHITRFPGECCAAVSRGGELQPCDKRAVAVTVDTEDGHWWPVCPHHSRGRPMVSLADLIGAIMTHARNDEGGRARDLGRV